MLAIGPLLPAGAIVGLVTGIAGRVFPRADQDAERSGEAAFGAGVSLNLAAAVALAVAWRTEDTPATIDAGMATGWIAGLLG